MHARTGWRGGLVAAALALAGLWLVGVVGGCELIAGLTDPRIVAADAGGNDDAGDAGSGDAGDTCSDGKKDGDETGVDCGGSCPMKCLDGEGCLTGADCADKVCSAGGMCLAATCGDMVQDGTETDVDCGGMTCEPCAFGKGCKIAADCVTGFCNAQGKCDAQTIVSGLDNPNSLAADSWGVYWADGDDGTIMQADFATLTQGQLAGGRSGPKGLVIQPDTGANMPSLLYWVEPTAGNVMQIQTELVPATPSTLVAGQDSPFALAVTPALLFPFWTANGGVWEYYITQQMLASFAGPGGKIAIAPGSTAGCYTIVYAANDSGGSLQNAAYADEGSSPGSCPILGNEAIGSAGIGGLTADATFAYWTDGAVKGTVAKTPLSLTDQPTVIAPGQATPTDIAVDASDVYWINQGTDPNMGAVMKGPIAGGSLTVVASGQDTPRGLVLSPTYVYWLTGAKGQGAVRRIPK